MENHSLIYPGQNCGFEFKNGLVIVVKEEERKLNKLEKKIFKNLKNRKHKLELDEIGSFVWQKCDGTLSIQEIVESVREEFGESAAPAEKRVDLFLTKLAQNDMIKLFQKQE